LNPDLGFFVFFMKEILSLFPPNLNIKYFGKTKVFLPPPDLLSLQKESWDRFWKEDFRELLKEVSPIRDYSKKELELWFLDYRMGETNYENDLEAKRNNDTFQFPFWVKTRLINLKTKEIKEQEVYFGEFPLMTERGTFIINGVERVVISQIIRSAGVLFTSQPFGQRNLFGASIIPTRGAWLEFETEPNGQISVKIDRKRKVPVTVLLRALGLQTNEEIKEKFKDVNIGEIDFIEETLKKDPTKNQEEALIEIYQRLKPGEIVTLETAKEFFENTFFNFERYDLSKVGRWKIEKRFGIERKEKEISIKDRVLKPEDVILTVKEIIRLNNTPQANPDEIDHLGNRRIRTLSELLCNRLRIGFMRLARTVKDKMATVDIASATPVQLINPRPVMAVLQEFFSSSQLAQFMDNENPLAELEHKRRVTASGPGGLSRERAGFEVRDVQPSHYGRLCPIETPEGQNIGLISHLAQYARVNPYGFLETPYYKVEKGKIDFSKVYYLSAYEEEKYNIASAGALVDEKGEILEREVEGRVGGEPAMIPKEKVEFIDVSPEQALSVATSLIPFLQNDDANRAQMGSNMQRQAVPLLNPEPPLVMTGLEPKVARDSGQVILAKESGKVVAVDGKKIKIKSKDTGKIQTYYLRTFVRTNQYTCFHQRPVVKKGQMVKKGQIIAEGAAISQGCLSLGKNLLVAFLPWRGANFEDACIISERLVKEDVFTSVHIENFGCDVRNTKLGPEITTNDIPNVSEERLKDLDEEGIIRIGAEVFPNDILVGKISPKGEATLTPEERLLRAIFGEKAKEVKDTSLRLEHGKKGKVIEIKIFDRELGHKLEPGVLRRIEVEIAEIRKIQSGDKLAGRHGNKSIISKVLPEEDMPFLEDGTPVDIVLNPLSIISRMNLGQVLETSLGLAAKKLGYYAVTPALSGATEEEIKEELKKAGFDISGKTTLFDGRTGLPFPGKVTVGYIYMMKLIHMVADKIHARSIGPYSLITQQPLGGKAQFGGQRFGEMEVWALEGYGAAYTLQEMLTIKSDDVVGRAATYQAILKGEEIKTPNIPASFNLLVQELKSLGIGVEIQLKEEEEKKKKEQKDES